MQLSFDFGEPVKKEKTRKLTKKELKGFTRDFVKKTGIKNNKKVL